MANTLEGLNCFVFTGGIGEHSPEMRLAIASRLAWLGVAVDEQANMTGQQVISTPSSKVLVLVVPTDEEAVIAGETFEVIGSGRAQA